LARAPPAARRRGDDGECCGAAIGLALFEIAALDRHLLARIGGSRSGSATVVASPAARRQAEACCDGAAKAE